MFNSLPGVFTAIFSKILSGATGNKTKELVGEKASRSIVGKAKAGKNADAKSQKPLRQSTINKRANAAKAGRLAPDTSPATSNLTRTGELLNSVTYDTRKANTVTIKPTGRDNIKKTRELEDAGFTYLGLTDSEIRKIEDIINQQIQIELDKLK